MLGVIKSLKSMMLKKAHRMANRSLKVLKLHFGFFSKNYHLIMFWKIKYLNF